jgi:hypothetical protein
MGRKDQLVNCTLHTMRDHISRYVTPVAVHNEEPTCLWILRPRLWLKDGNKPLVRMAVRRPAAIASREPPVLRRVGSFQAVSVCYALEMIRGGIAAPAALTHLMAVIRSCRPAITFQLNFSRTLANAPED